MRLIALQLNEDKIVGRTAHIMRRLAVRIAYRNRTIPMSIEDAHSIIKKVVEQINSDYRLTKKKLLLYEMNDLIFELGTETPNGYKCYGTIYISETKT